MILSGIGEDINREGLLETPDRIAKCMRSLSQGMKTALRSICQNVFMLKTVIWCWKRIFASILSASTICFLLRQGAVAYIPNGEVVGLSKIARTVEVFAKRFQPQERLAAQVADAFMQELNPKGVMVLMEAEHMCMTMRGIRKPGAQTITVITRGIF